jgi:hypothetical protein
VRTVPRPRTARLLALFCLAVALAAPSPPARADEPSPDVTQPPPFDQFLVIPLRVHILTATDLPELDCHLTYSDVARVLKKVNGIWHKAGIHWGLESVVREPAARQDRFRLVRELDRPLNLATYRAILPGSGRRTFEGLNVYYLHEFPVNGVWLGGDAAIIQETARLRKVEGGIDEPLPRVTAHELGHALGLPHRQDTTNLLASGTTGTLLNAREVETVRKKARSIRGVRDVADLKAEARDAEARGDAALGRRFRTWLGEIPGGLNAIGD